MNESYNNCFSEFIKFKTTLKSDILYNYENKYSPMEIILNNKQKISSNNCYCIKEKFYNDFENLIDKLSHNNKKNKNIREFLSSNSPEFINDIESAKNHLQNKLGLKLVSSKFINYIYKNNDNILKKNNSVKYFAGKNKLIIEFNNNDICNALLIINPLENISNQRIYYFSIKAQKDFKLSIFNSLINNEMDKKFLTKNHIDIKELTLKSQKEIMPRQNRFKETNNLESFNIILKFFIALNYYEMTLPNNKEIMLNQKEKAYLISHDWIKNIKSNFNYEALSNIFIKIKKQIDYSNFSQQIEHIYCICYKNDEIAKIITTSKGFDSDLKPKEKTEEELSYFESCYIIPKKILRIIQSLYSTNVNNSIHSSQFICSKNYIYLIKGEKIYICKLSNEKYLITKYVLFYTKKEILQSEINDLLNNLTKYFLERKCTDDSLRIQNLIGKGNQNIGKLLNLEVTDTKNGYINSFINKDKKEKNIKKNNLNSSMDFIRNVNVIDDQIKKDAKKKRKKSYDNNKEYQNNINVNVIKDYSEKSINNNALIKQKNSIESNEIVEEITQNKNKNDEILIEKEKYKNELKESQNEIIKLTELNNKLKNNLIEEKNKNKILEKSIENYKKEINELKIIYEQKNKDDELEKISNEKEELFENNKILTEENRKLNDKFEIYVKKYESAKEKLKSLKNNSNDTDKQKEKNLKNMEKEINKRIRFLEDMEDELGYEKDLQKKLNKYKEENNNLKTKIDELQKQIQKKDEEFKQIQLSEKINNPQNKIAPNIIIDSYNNNMFNINNFEINNNGNNNFGKNRFRSNSLPNKAVPPIKLYIQPTLIGLNNLGATCFMNATLQCLSQTEDLTNYFLSDKNENIIYNKYTELLGKKELCLSKAYLDLIKKLWSKTFQKSAYSPKNFMKTVGEMNSLFKNGDPGDSKDFIIFILEQIHRELKKSIINITNLKTSQPLNQYDRQSAFNYFFEGFQKECSIISDIFFGFNETTNVCTYCQNYYHSKGLNNPVCYNYGIFNCIIIPLEEVRKMKNNYNQMFNNNVVTLYDCFMYNQKSELFTGENKNYCNVCRQLFNSVYTSKIYVSPNILIIILNRGKNNIFNVKLDYSFQLDITNFVSFQNERTIYNLYGIITHIGQSGPNAHFIASCKSPIDQKWYRYNDAIVSPITNIQNEVINFGVPYILFYQKQK